MSGLTPYCAKNELNGSILFSYKIQAYSNCRLADHNRSNMVANTDGRNLWAVEQFEYIHADQHLRCNDENIPLGN